MKAEDHDQTQLRSAMWAANRTMIGCGALGGFAIGSLFGLMGAAQTISNPDTAPPTAWGRVLILLWYPAFWGVSGAVLLMLLAAGYAAIVSVAELAYSFLRKLLDGNDVEEK